MKSRFENIKLIQSNERYIHIAYNIEVHEEIENRYHTVYMYIEIEKREENLSTLPTMQRPLLMTYIPPPRSMSSRRKPLPLLSFTFIPNEVPCF